MLDVGVVFHRVGDDVMRVVIIDPPAQRKATNIVGEENAIAPVNLSDACDATVASVVTQGKMPAARTCPCRQRKSGSRDKSRSEPVKMQPK